MSEKPAVCFVDDDPAELARFADNLADRFVIGAGTSVDEALADLRAKGRQRPDLFVLDLYFPEGAGNTPEQREELKDAWNRFLDAKGQFAAVLDRLGQTSRGGFALARGLRDDRRLRKAGVAFFSRKGTFEDAIEAYAAAGALAVIKKPDPTPEEKAGKSPDEAFDLAFGRSADGIARDIQAAIRRATWWGRHRRLVAGIVLGILLSLAAAVVAKYILGQPA
ncbi:MAG TPA: hypothetical protein VMZ50_06535 [Phycisphaerae bacterium]|nr:hypothetical protein [Phycisphaerae bacterium]